jgi:hypothetical protein
LGRYELGQRPRVATGYFVDRASTERESTLTLFCGFIRAITAHLHDQRTNGVIARRLGAKGRAERQLRDYQRQ